MKLKAILAGAVLAVLAQPVAAQQTERQQVLAAAYGLWGMMEGAAVFCAEALTGDFSVPLTHIDWVARNVAVMDELEAERQAMGEPDYLTGEWMAVGRDGITGILQQAANPAGACTNWKTETEAGGYEAETFLVQQLGILRERDGL
jgi:hypothetical protein